MFLNSLCLRTSDHFLAEDTCTQIIPRQTTRVQIKPCLFYCFLHGAQCKAEKFQMCSGLCERWSALYHCLQLGQHYSTPSTLEKSQFWGKTSRDKQKLLREYKNKPIPRSTLKPSFQTVLSTTLLCNHSLTPNLKLLSLIYSSVQQAFMFWNWPGSILC